MSEELGRELIRALSKGAFDSLPRLFHPEVHLQGLTPGRFNEAKGETAIEEVTEIFKLWFFEDDDRLDSVEWCDVRPVGRNGRYKLSFGLRGKSPGMCDWYRVAKLRDLPDETDWIVEQEAYYDVRDGKIGWMILLCGGYHPADEVAAPPASRL